MINYLFCYTIALLKTIFANKLTSAEIEISLISMELTLQAIRRLIKRAGAKRISDQAVKELARVLEERAKAMLVESKRLSEHAGRRTVMKHDIKMARKTVGKK